MRSQLISSFFGHGSILYASTVMLVNSFSLFTPSSLYLNGKHNIAINNVILMTFFLLNVVEAVSLEILVPLFEDLESVFALLLFIVFECCVAEEGVEIVTVETGYKVA